MARKPRKSKAPKSKASKSNAAESEPVPELSLMPRPAVLLILAIVLLMGGLTAGIVIDVSTRPEPARVSAPSKDRVSNTRPSRNVPRTRIEAPRTPSIFDVPPEVPTTDAAPVVVVPEIPLSAPLAVNAAPVDAPPGWPIVAIVIDDMGLDRARSSKVLALPGPLTVSYLTYADDLNVQAKRAIDAGHEVMAHVPMEPVGNADPGPGALMSGTSAPDLREQLDSYLNGWSGYVGINNHMGSKLTSDRAAMDVVMMELKGRGLMWLDSRTDASTIGETAATAMGVPNLGRDIFLDNEDSEEAIAAQLAKLESIARRQGYAVAIGHPRDATMTALAKWLATLNDKGIALAPVTEVLRRRMGKKG
jgi:uncharacterized protein